jgi:hypothetical protein
MARAPTEFSSALPALLFSSPYSFPVPRCPCPGPQPRYAPPQFSSSNQDRHPHVPFKEAPAFLVCRAPRRLRPSIAPSIAHLDRSPRSLTSIAHLDRSLEPLIIPATRYELQTPSLSFPTLYPARALLSGLVALITDNYASTRPFARANELRYVIQ